MTTAKTTATELVGSSAREIAASAEAAIRHGALEAGDALPTVRALADRLGVSPATVASGYRILRERGLVTAAGRRGTRVVPRPAVRTPSAAIRIPEAAEVPAHLRDLRIGLPDPELLPRLRPALERVDLERKLRIGGLETPDPELIDAAARGFAADGVPTGAMTVVNGAFDGIERALQTHLRPGDRVIVEDPAYISTRDLLLALGLVAVPVAVDEYGLIPAALERGLAGGADAAIVVPRAQNPIGAAFDRQRASALRDVFGSHPELLLIEDDHAWLVGGAEFESSIDPARPRWAVIRSMSKMLHPDLRTAIMAGDPTTIGRIEGRQALGPRWVSPLLQAVAAEMLRAPDFEAVAARAQDEYSKRRRALVDACAARGLVAHGRAGLNVWVNVREEEPVVRALLDAEWLVMPGERFRFATPPGVRITSARLRDGEAEEVAEIVAQAELAGHSRQVY